MFPPVKFDLNEKFGFSKIKPAAIFAIFIEETSLVPAIFQVSVAVMPNLSNFPPFVRKTSCGFKEACSAVFMIDESEEMSGTAFGEIFVVGIAKKEASRIKFCAESLIFELK